MGLNGELDQGGDKVNNNNNNNNKNNNNKVPHFTLLVSLKLLVCTQKMDLVSKGRKDSQGVAGFAGDGPPRAAVVQGRKDTL